MNGDLNKIIYTHENFFPFCEALYKKPSLLMLEGGILVIYGSKKLKENPDLRQAAKRLICCFKEKVNSEPLQDYAVAALSHLETYCQDQKVKMKLANGIKNIKELTVSSGKPQELYKIAELYAKGLGVKKDLKKAFALYQLAAAQGYAPAQTQLGVCFIEGFGVDKDEQEAIKFFHLASDQGHIGAIFYLAFCTYSGMGIEKNEQEGKELFQKAVEEGLFEFAVECKDAGLQFLLSNCYTVNIFVEIDERKAFAFLKLAADNGSAQAQYEVACHYIFSVRWEWVVTDRKQGIKYYKLAAYQGHAAAQYQLAKHYEVIKKGKKAEKFYELVSAQGHLDALYNLGLRCIVRKNYKKGAELYKRAEDHPLAIIQLHKLYMKGKGVPQDEAKAMQLKKIFENLAETSNFSVGFG